MNILKTSQLNNYSVAIDVIIDGSIVEEKLPFAMLGLQGLK